MNVPPQSQMNISQVNELISINFDSRQYFFAKADENWLDFLWDNGLLDAIKEKALDPTTISYRMPELKYLGRIAEKEPKKVTDIMLSIPVSKDTFNPEVIDQFLRICSTLPARELAQMVVKIHDEGWVQLMGPFNQWGFDYEKMFQTLSAANDCDSILTLAEAILVVRDEEEINRSQQRFMESAFYFSDLSYTNVFEHLVSLEKEYAEEAFELSTKVMSNIVLLGDKDDKSAVFPIYDDHHLFDVDFFDLDLSRKSSRDDDVHALAATIKILAQNLIGNNCADVRTIRSIYKKNIQPLPDSSAMWRLRLFVLSLCPEAFKDELYKVYFRLFEEMDAGKNYHDVISGTEYKKALKKGFCILNNEQQRNYVEKIFEHLGRNSGDEQEQRWFREDGWRIFSCVCEFLTKEEQEKCEEVFKKKCDPNYDPKPVLGSVKSGVWASQSPVPDDEFQSLTIPDISKKLRNEWSPEQLRLLNIGGQIINSINAEGLSEQLRANMPKRLQDYVKYAALFFERDVLDQHYTYSYLRGLQEVIKNHTELAQNIEWTPLIEVCINILESGRKQEFNQKKRPRDYHSGFLAAWSSVYGAIADVVQQFLLEDEKKLVIDFTKHRDELFTIISELLSHPDPRPQDEDLKTAKSKTKSAGGKDYFVSDPFNIAINSVRGRAFQAFTLFVNQDSKKFKENTKIRIASDSKKLLERVLDRENTRALMFMFGYYLPRLYYYDKNWIHSLLPQIFSEQQANQHLYVAAWEGYLANNLCEQIFFDQKFQRLYTRGLSLTGKEDPERKYFKDLNEGIATHIALAFVVFNQKYGFQDMLFKDFWERDNPTQQKEFVKSIGRIFLSGDNTKNTEFLDGNEQAKKRIEEFWDWVLERCNEQCVFEEFGYWINIEKKIFNIPWLARRVQKTLEKTKGIIERDYGLEKAIVDFAKLVPENTLSIAHLFLLEGVVRGKQRSRTLYADKAWFEAIKILYKNSSTKLKTYNLIDDLIREGGSAFWELKEIFDEKAIG